MQFDPRICLICFLYVHVEGEATKHSGFISLKNGIVHWEKDLLLIITIPFKGGAFFPK